MPMPEPIPLTLCQTRPRLHAQLYSWAEWCWGVKPLGHKLAKREPRDSFHQGGRAPPFPTVLILLTDRFTPIEGKTLAQDVTEVDPNHEPQLPNSLPVYHPLVEAKRVGGRPVISCNAHTKLLFTPHPSPRILIHSSHLEVWCTLQLRYKLLGNCYGLSCVPHPQFIC